MAEKRRIFPQACHNVALIGRQVAHQGNHHHKRVFRHGFIAVSADIAHCRAVLFGSLNVHIVDACRGNGNQLELWIFGKCLGGNHDFIGNHNVCAADALQRFVRFGCAVAVQCMWKIEIKRAVDEGIAVEDDNMERVYKIPIKNKISIYKI